MAQYDVYPNPIQQARADYPFVVDVQTGLIDQLPTRLVMPISRVGSDVAKLPLTLSPAVEIGGEILTISAHLAAPVSARLLKRPVMSLSHRASDIAAALDAVTSGF